MVQSIKPQTPDNIELVYNLYNEGFTMLNEKGVRVLAGLRLEGLNYEQVSHSTITATSSSTFIANKHVGYNAYVINEIIDPQGHIANKIRISKESTMFAFIYPTEIEVQ